MLTFHFEGWYQCRFPTNPDPSDEKRGFSGTTIAMPGEPDFDRIIRLQNPVAIRYPFDRPGAFGVFVKRVSLDDPGPPAQSTDVPDHPLVGAAVDLLDGAQYQQQNLIIVTQPFATPVDPFRIQIQGAGVTLSRKDVFDVFDPDMTIRQASEIGHEKMARRINSTMIVDSPRVAEATGIMDADGYRRTRKRELEALLDHTTDPTARLALETRIRFIDRDPIDHGYGLAARIFLGTICDYAFDVNGPPDYTVVEDPENVLGGRVGVSQDWPLTFWMGGYDVDTMCGYMKGSLSVPFYADRS